MGKAAKTSKIENSNSRVKKKKRRRDLEQIRHKSLDAKRNLKKQSAPQKSTDTNLEKTLKKFAPLREEIEHETQTKNQAKKNSKILCYKLLPDVGLYRKGIKSKEFNKKEKVRPLNTTKEARRADNYLELLNGDSEPQNQRAIELKKIVNCSGSSEAESSIENPKVDTAGGEENSRAAEQHPTKTLERAENALLVGDDKRSKSKDKYGRRLFNSSDSSEIDEPEMDRIHFSPRLTRRQSGLLREQKQRHDILPKKVYEEKAQERRRPTYEDIEKYEKYCAKMGKEKFAHLKVDQGEHLKESIASLQKIYLENKKKPAKCFELQACSAKTSSTSQISNPFFQKEHSYRSSEITPATVVLPINKKNLTLQNVENRKFELPSSLFRPQEDYVNPGLYSVEVNVGGTKLPCSAEESSMTMSKEENSDERLDMILRYLRDCRLMRTSSNLAKTMGNLENDERDMEEHRKREKQQPRLETTKNSKHAATALKRNSNSVYESLAVFNEKPERREFFCRGKVDDSFNFPQPSTSHNYYDEHKFVYGPQRNAAGRNAEMRGEERSMFVPIPEDREVEQIMQNHSFVRRRSRVQLESSCANQPIMKYPIEDEDLHRSFYNRDFAKCHQSQESRKKQPVLYLKVPLVNVACESAEKQENPRANFQISRQKSLSQAVGFRSPRSQSSDSGILIGEKPHSQPVKYVAFEDDHAVSRRPIYQFGDEGLFRKAEKNEQRRIQQIFVEQDRAQLYKREDERTNIHQNFDVFSEVKDRQNIRRKPFPEGFFGGSQCCDRHRERQ